MDVSYENVKIVRKMIAESSPDSEITDDEISAAIGRHPVDDMNGAGPWIRSATAPTPTINPAWIPTYDLHAAAADLWEMKAARFASDFDFSADGGTYRRSQVVDHAMRMARFHASRRSVYTITQRPEPMTEDGHAGI